MDLSLRQLSVFVSVAHRLSFTAAANDLLVSQSSLSRTVAEIERVLGTSVFHRDTRNVTLTDEGRELLEVAEHVLGVHRAGMRQLRRFVDGSGGTVSVAALPSVAAVLLPPVITAFRRRWPETDVRIHDGLARSVVEAVERGDADFAVTVATDGAPWVSGRPLVRDLFVGVVPPGHPLADRDELSWADLRDEQFIAMGAGSSVRALTDLAFTQAGGAGRGVVEASSFATVGGLVSAGLGVTALPALVRALLGFAPVEHRPLTGPVVRRGLDLLWPTDRPMSAAARRFLATIDELRSGGFELPPDVHWAEPR
ncbi:LysR substrate-binding domain-containing protein [Nocardiopsis sp. CT-R113]|uniref:LysR substrate-binding domain-containing protein n=1 Tax=Nocardiopsis codii TaxID=3065942 RepID=A0ABU7KEN0_9ACTN|nr:LysR substrate-binding domain-containing protein [Nocardiopsis sp. CT-R113]MEE2040688.1 LysR substrate-binding domain-containing protein [Nocardiopsis sp. CT-R113]